MGNLRVGPFGGIAPKLAPHLLPTTSAVKAQNCILDSGEMRPLMEPSFVWTPTKIGTIQTIYFYKSQYWFHWLEQCDVVESPLANDSYGRVYWTGENEPRYSTLTLATTGGGTNYPIGYYILGIAAPTSDPTQSAGTPSDTNNVQSRSYIYTYVSAYGEESPPTNPSPVFDITDGDSVTVTCPGLGPSGAYNIASKNIYRLNDGIYQFLATIPVSTTTYIDTTKNSALGDSITSTEYDPPPSDMVGIINIANGSMAGFTENELCLSEPYLPHAWPVRYRIPFSGGIKSIGAFGNSIIVTAGNAKPYVVTGDNPGSMFVEQFEVGHACMSKRGTVDMGNSVIFPSPFGLVVVGTGTAGLATKEIIDPNEFVGYANPTTILGCKYGDNYIGFNSVGGVDSGFLFNTKTGDMTTTSITATATYTDPATGKLYIVDDNGDIVEFNGGLTPIGIEWQSKHFVTSHATNYSRGQVIAEDYPVSFEVYADGELKTELDINDNKPFTLSGGFLSEEWDIKLKSDYAVKSVSIANSVGEL